MHKDFFLNPVMNSLAAFEVVARNGSVSEAARLMDTSQPALSRHIRNLEEHLGVPLFHRIKKRLSLTREGEQLFSAVQSGLAEIRDQAWNLHELSGSKLITINCGYGLAHFWLFDEFPNLQRKIPDFDLQLSVTQTGISSSSDSADISIRIGAGHWEGFESILLIPEDVALACSPQFAQKHGLDLNSLLAADICKLPLIHMDKGEYGAIWFKEWFEHFDFNYEPNPKTLYYNSYALTLEAAIEHKGICIVWRHLAGRSFESGELVEIPGTRVKTSNGYFITYKPNRIHEAGIPEIIELLLGRQT